MTITKDQVAYNVTHPLTLYLVQPSRSTNRTFDNLNLIRFLSVLKINKKQIAGKISVFYETFNITI